MTKIVGERNTIQIEEASFEAAVSEGTMSRIGAAVNYIMDRIIIPYRGTYGGFFRSTSIDQGDNMLVVERVSNISSFYVSVWQSGSSGTTAINFGVYDETGVFLSNLFTTDIIISPSSNDQGLIIGRRGVDETTPVDFEINTSNATVDIPDFNMTQLQGNYSLVPNLISNATSARNLTYEIRFKEV